MLLQPFLEFPYRKRLIIIESLRDVAPVLAEYIHLVAGFHAFRNDRNLATITGISSDGLVGLTAAALLLIGAFLRGLFARCRRREMEEYGI